MNLLNNWVAIFAVIGILAFFIALPFGWHELKKHFRKPKPEEKEEARDPFHMVDDWGRN